MTRLLKDDRRRLVNDIMADVPLIDYKAQLEAAALKIAVEQLPLDARRLWRDPLTRGLLATTHCYVGYRQGKGYIAGFNLPGFHDQHKDLEKWPELTQLIYQAITQEDERSTLRIKLQANVADVTTHEEFTRRWPDLAKYLPTSSPARPENLPVSTELIDQLRAAGLELDAA